MSYNAATVTHIYTFSSTFLEKLCPCSALALVTVERIKNRCISYIHSN